MSIGSLNPLDHPGGPRWVLGHRGEADQGPREIMPHLEVGESATVLRGGSAWLCELGFSFWFATQAGQQRSIGSACPHPSALTV